MAGSSTISPEITPQIINLTAAGLAIVAATYGLARYCFGLFLPEIRAAFNMSTETVGLIAGLSYAGYLAATFAGAWLSTLYEPRLPIFLGGLAASLGMALIGLASGPEMLAAGVFIAGMSPGLAYPPFSDVVVRHTPAKRQNTLYAWINSGTGFGVAIAGPLALATGEDWRLNWLVFAALAACFTLWNLSAIPRRSIPRQSIAGLSLQPMFQASARPLFLAALLFGVVTAIYWTYAVDLLTSLTGDQRSAVLFWIVLGVAGVTGCFAGGLANRIGLGKSYVALMATVASAIATLPLLSQWMIGIYASAALFGSGFIVATALFGMWSMRMFPTTPSIAFGFTFFLISLGQGIGPIIGGFLAPLAGLETVFVLAGLACFGLVFLRPGNVSPSSSDP